MTVAPKLTDDERARIAALCAEGKSRNEIAAEVGRSPDSISRVAAEIGHEFGQTNLARAHEARSNYSAEVRARIAAKAAERALKILDGFDDKQPVVVGGGENGAEVLDVALDARGQRDRASAAQILARTVLDIAKLDEKAEQGQARGLLEQLVASLEDR